MKEGGDRPIATFLAEHRPPGTQPMTSSSAGQQSERIRLRLKGGDEGIDLRLGDRVGVYDLEVNTRGKQNAHNS